MTPREVQLLHKIVEAAAQMAAGSLSFIDGARQITRLRSSIAELTDDPDIRAFVLIESETDELPSNSERHLWSADALEKLQPAIDRAEGWARQVGTPHCERLIARFQKILTESGSVDGLP
jgi:hypothetical protein